MSLRTRILLLVLLATLVPAVMFSVIQFRHHESQIENAKHDLGSLANYAAQALEGKISGTVQLLHGLSRAPDLDTQNKAACSRFLAGVLALYPQYTGLLTILPSGDLHCDSLQTRRLLNVKSRHYFQEARSTLKPAFEVVFGGLTGIAVLQVAYPVLDSRGALEHVLLASLNLSEYAQDFAAVSRYRGMRVLIWNQKGVLMARHPDDGAEKLAGKEYSASPLFRFVTTVNTGATAELPDLDGVPRIWALGVIPQPEGGGARITVGVAREVLVADADKDLRNALLLLFGISVLAFLGAWYVAEAGIRSHVTRIANVAGRVGAGDLNARIGAPYPKGELGELMAVVDSTAVAVQAQQQEMERSSNDLKRSNRTLRVLSGINTLIVRVRDRDELFREACRVAIEDGQFRMAWIGVVDYDEMCINEVASAGVQASIEAQSSEHLRHRLSLKEGASTGYGPAVMAVKERRAVVVNDVLSDPKVRYRDTHLERGVRSFVIIPLLIEDKVVAVFSLHAAEAGYFDAEEMKLLIELAGNIAYAIDYIGKQERLDYLAYYDVLTGLANRNLFIERLTQSMRVATAGGHKLAVGLIDLERFKNINDGLGRPAGDALLMQVAEWLTHNMGDANLLARVGTDHFAVLLPKVRADGDLASLVDKQIAAFLDHPFRLNNTVFRIAFKAGIALFPDDGAEADALLRNAEAALKKAKTSGDRYLYYTQQMNAAAAGRLALENQLRRALENEEFVLHYQPKVDLSTGKMVSAEALIRWNDPITGLVPPGRFIPMLEETGLIHDVGRWALRKAIGDYLRWRAAGLPAVRIAVNVSPLQLRSRGFIAEVQHEISVDPRAPAGLELEITETLIMEDVRHSIASLQAIRAMGVTVAIDDFGTGFSSLSYLAKLPVDTLKIDRSFVIDMTVGPEGLSLVSTIINLAHSLKLKVVAEGVETEEQSRLLRLLGCDEMQGFLFSKPVPADLFETRYLAPPADAGRPKDGGST